MHGLVAWTSPSRFGKYGRLHNTLYKQSPYIAVSTISSNGNGKGCLHSALQSLPYLKCYHPPLTFPISSMLTVAMGNWLSSVLCQLLGMGICDGLCSSCPFPSSRKAYKMSQELMSKLVLGSWVHAGGKRTGVQWHHEIVRTNRDIGLWSFVGTEHCLVLRNRQQISHWRSKEVIAKFSWVWFARDKE